MCPSAKQVILARILHFFDNLRAAPFLGHGKKHLHPGWLFEFAKEHLNYFDDRQSPSCSWQRTDVEMELIEQVEEKARKEQQSEDEDK
ncbi:hypothetical protein AVEN_128822-1 [Araneus ventricosus]|uniref:Uncharacterized protein n=1 Tax=Araneus ventricosus TaxID=182803 RepID=A0A4Y2K7N5_ARAVE|nr:hypothetical protein AVEN_128822-1 [Araneus ventricosus]